MWSVSRVFCHSAAGGRGGQSSATGSMPSVYPARSAGSSERAGASADPAVTRGMKSTQSGTDPPRPVTGFDDGDGPAGGDVDDGDVIRQPVRGVKCLLVAAERNAPRPRAGRNGLQHAVRHCINLYYSVAAAGRGEDGL